MPVHAETVGTKLTPVQAQMTPRRMLAFAAGLQHTSPALLDDLHPDFCVAPQVCVALEWQSMVQNNLGALVGASPEEYPKAVHAIQDSTFIRPVRAGETLTTHGEVTGLWCGRSGTNMAVQFYTYDGSDALVYTSYVQSTYRGVALIGDSQEPDRRPIVPAPSDRTQPPISIEIDIPRTFPHTFSECADIWNPIHTERTAAKTAGLPDIILHGVATWALAGRDIVAACAAQDITRLRRLRGRLAGMVIPGKPLQLTLQAHADGDTLHVLYAIKTPDGSPAIRDGYACLDLSR
ncbi:MAG: MaoC/PaaZ C-terminal domain-containing protein [Pseudomonadota bacterium]